MHSTESESAKAVTPTGTNPVCLSVRACGAVLRLTALALENRKVPLSYKRPKASSLSKTQSVYTGGTEIFSCVKRHTQDLQRIRKYYILEK